MIQNLNKPSLPCVLDFAGVASNATTITSRGTMPTAKHKDRKTDKLQDAQRKLVAEGMKLPGVAEVTAIYGALVPYTAWRWSASTQVQHATDANLENENNEVRFA